MVRLLATVALAVLLSGCEDSNRPVELARLFSDDWACTTSHVHTWTSYVLVGKVMMPQTHRQTICDQYTRKPSA